MIYINPQEERGGGKEEAHLVCVLDAAVSAQIKEEQLSRDTSHCSKILMEAGLHIIACS